jgi:hypothetical protein
MTQTCEAPEDAETIVDVSDQFKCLKAEQRGMDVLILRKLNSPIQRVDGKRASFELEYRWLSDPTDIHRALGDDYTFWRASEIPGWQTKSLFDVFRLFA